jgi:catechol 2,3-dioxygenase-like lactoylglutathione lyase family enzyme
MTRRAERPTVPSHRADEMDRFSASALTHLLVVADARASRDGYVQVLDASVYGQYDTSVVLQPLGTWLLRVEGGDPTPDKPSVTFAPPADPDRVSTQLIVRVEDGGRTYELLPGRGAAFLTEPVDRGGEIRAFCRDPDGHLVEISELT